MFSSFFESILPTVYADEQPASSSDAVEAKSDVNQVKEEKENEHTIEDHIEETAEEEEEEEEVEDVSRPSVLRVGESIEVELVESNDLSCNYYNSTRARQEVL